MGVSVALRGMNSWENSMRIRNGRLFSQDKSDVTPVHQIHNVVILQLRRKARSTLFTDLDT
jgi:hypothetical protein